MNLRSPGIEPSHDSGFTFVELLVVAALVIVLAALLFPALSRSKASAQRISCLNNLHQLAVATQMYWDENNGNCFRYRTGVTNNGQLYWFGWIGSGPEGQRAFDPTPSPLYPYVQDRRVQLCPAFNYFFAQVKLKAQGASYGYGYNWFLSAPPAQPAVNISRILRGNETALLADAAQVNTWQSPASPSNPMIEEWYYVDDNTNQPNTHFRHAHKANVLFCDGHIRPERPIPGSLDKRMPGQFVGTLNPRILLLP